MATTNRDGQLDCGANRRMVSPMFDWARKLTRRSKVTYVPCVRPITPEAALQLDLKLFDAADRKRLTAGLCLQCGQEPILDGLFGARCIEETQNEHRRVRW
jgi:hypothetical protein